jgi:phosphoribosylamine--glycine ligase
MKILLIGSGAREHALAWKISKSPLLECLYLWPGNPASKSLGTPLDLPPTADHVSVGNLAIKLGISAVICGPEQPLEAGFANTLWSMGLPVFGPKQEAAKLESSKLFAKNMMAKAGINTAHFSVATSEAECREQAFARLAESGGVVLKASGLASGKGVFVCTNEAEILAGLKILYGQTMRAASETVVVESVLVGQECSYFTLIGQGISTGLGFAVDYKRLLSGDKGPNTGGMGSYAPVSWLPTNAGERVEAEVVKPLLKVLADLEIDYCGWLYVGLMWNEQGPQVIEFNVRLGDPEAQILVVADDRDWLELILDKLGVRKLTADKFTPWNHDKRVVGVVMASAGYPYGGKTEDTTELPAGLFSNRGDGCCTFAAAVENRLGENKIYTGSGRVLTVVASGATFFAARNSAMRQVNEIANIWPGCQWRDDVAKLVASEEK